MVSTQSRSRSHQTRLQSTLMVKTSSWVTVTSHDLSWWHPGGWHGPGDIAITFCTTKIVTNVNVVIFCKGILKTQSQPKGGFLIWPLLFHERIRQRLTRIYHLPIISIFCPAPASWFLLTDTRALSSPWLSQSLASRAASPGPTLHTGHWSADHAPPWPWDRHKNSYGQWRVCLKKYVNFFYYFKWANR